MPALAHSTPLLFSSPSARLRVEAELPIHADRAQAALDVLARSDPNVFTPLVLRDESNGAPVVQGPQHLMWQHIWRTFDRSLITAFTGGGKCEAAGARVLLADGRQVPIEQLSGRSWDFCILDPDTFATRTVRAAVTPNGTKPVWRVQTKSGRVLKLTDEHPLLRPTDWCKAKDLQVGDWLATARSLPEPAGPSPMDPGEAALLGYIVGDGTAGQPHRCGFTNADKDVLDHVRELSAARGWHVLPTHPPYDFSISRPNGHSGWAGVEAPSVWLKRHDANHGAHDKRVPEAVFRSSNATVGAFIGAYFACDGHVHSGKNTLELTSVSRGLLEDVQLLLLRFGVVAAVMHHAHPKFPSWRLYVTGSDMVALFREHCPVRGAKAVQLAALEPSPKAYSVNDVVPGVWRDLYHRPITGSDAVYYGVNATAAGNHRASVRRVLAGSTKHEHVDRRILGNPTHNDTVARLASEGVFWDRIVSIEVLPPEETWAVEVFDPAHCYLSSGVVSHNTQQLVSYILWSLGNNPSLRVGVLCSTITRARKIVAQVGKYIQDSEHLHRIFPELRHRSHNWSDFGFTVKRDTIAKDPSIQAIGLHTGILGARLDLVVFDDVVDYENSRSAALREDTINWVKSTLFGRFAKETRVLGVGNAYHPEDLMHHLEKLPGWASFKFPVLDKAGKSVWNHMFPLSRVQQKRDELGELEFARQMLCVARTDLESRFSSEWIAAAKVLGAGIELVREYEPTSAELVVTGVDLGVQTHAKADLTVLFTIAVSKYGKRVVLNIESGRWAADEIVRRCADHHKRYGSVIVVENNAGQDFLVQFLRLGHTNVPVKTHTTGKTKHHPVLGIEGMAVEFSKGDWVIPSKRRSKEIDAWEQEMLYFDPAGHTGDRLAASWIARSYALRAASKSKTLKLDLFSR